MTTTIQPRASGEEALVLHALRAGITRIDREILELVARRASVARDIGLAKRIAGRPIHDAGREREHQSELSRIAHELGLPARVVRDLFQALARHSIAEQTPAPEAPATRPTPPDSDAFRLARHEPGRPLTIVRVGDAEIGSHTFEVIAGPCAVESIAQITDAADHCRAAGVRIMRGGAFKPRTSPYEFQGHGMRALTWLAEAAHARGMAIVTEVLDPALAPEIAQQADMLQIGARNMQNVPLLRAAARTGRPIMLKRGPSSTLRELLCAAEYILLEGNPNVVLCERGLRSFERETRNTLDLAAVPALAELTHLPVIVDPSHAAGRNELIPALCRAAHGAGAAGVIVEMHPCKEEALCDKRQALTPVELRKICEGLQLRER